MSLKAEVLRTNTNKLKSVMKEVSCILGHIDDEIKTAYDKDCNNIAVTLPITFSIPYMSNKNAQRMVYYKVLESLLSRGYIVDIHMASDKTVYYIKWLSEEEEKEADLQNAILAKHTLKITNVLPKN